MSDANDAGKIGCSIGLTNPAKRKLLSPSAISLFIEIACRWSLKDSDALRLLGAVTPATLLEWKSENQGRTLGHLLHFIENQQPTTGLSTAEPRGFPLLFYPDSVVGRNRIGRCVGGVVAERIHQLSGEGRLANLARSSHYLQKAAWFGQSLDQWA